MASTKKYTQKFSVLRVITNSTASVVAIIVFLLGLPQFFGYKLYMNKYYLFSAIVLELGILAFIIIYCIREYKLSYFYIDEKEIVFHEFYSPKKLDKIALKNIQSIEIKSLNVVITSKDDKKLVLEYLSKPKELKKTIEKLM